MAPSLENPETSAEPHISQKRWGPPEHDDAPPILPVESRFRHSGWAAERKKVFAALILSGASTRRLDRFANCGCNAWVATRGDDICVVSDKCHDRWCTPCQVERRAGLSAAVAHRVHAAGGGRMLTLTLRSLAAHKLPDQLDRLQASFRRLRQREWWKRHVTGGVACLEVKRGKRGQWHPHLHVVCVGRRIAHKELSAEWLAVTGDSSVVWITPVDASAKAAADVAAYVSKYATKPMSVSQLCDTDLALCMTLLKGKKLVTPIGDWAGLADEDPEPGGKLQMICSFGELGKPEFARWREALERKWPAMAQFLPHPTPADSDPAPP